MKEKYTIELTQNQASQLNDVILGFCKGSWAYNPPKRLEVAREPEVIERVVENPNGNAIYDQGFEDGVNSVSDNSAKVAEVKDKLIKKGYDQGFKDAQLKAKFDAEDVQRKHENECQEQYRKGYREIIADLQELASLSKEEYIEYVDYTGYGICKGIYTGFGRIIQEHGMNAIEKFRDWKEKKDKEIKVGDEVFMVDKDDPKIVVSINKCTGTAGYLSKDGKHHVCYIGDLHKTGRNVADKLEELFEDE